MKISEALSRLKSTIYEEPVSKEYLTAARTARRSLEAWEALIEGLNSHIVEYEDESRLYFAGRKHEAQDIKVFVDRLIKAMESEEESTKVENIKTCATCGQPRDYKDMCILYNEGECNRYSGWMPKQSGS